MAEPRYFVDNRLDCVAVRDRTKAVDHREKDLKHDQPDVVQLWSKAPVISTCPTCGYHRVLDGWVDDGPEIPAAEALAKKLNENPT